MGGTREVGRACIHVESSDKSSFLLDCGINLGEKEEKRYPLEPPSAPHSIVLTHAHLDHSGFLPILVKNYKENIEAIFSTPVTADIAEVLLLDSLRLSKIRDDIEAPFDVEDVLYLRKHAVDVNYRVPLDIDGGQMILYRSGHIIGASMVWVEIDGHTILYTSDLNTRHSRTIYQADAEILPVETVIIESTYAHTNDRHPSLKKIEREFAEDVKRALNRGGKVIVPAFAVGRSQEAMLTLEAYVRSGFLPKVPIYIDGLIRKINEVYKLYWFLLRPEIRRQIRYTKQSPLESDIFRLVSDRDEPISSLEPCVVITTSGMLEGGPVVHYLKKLAEDERNLICLTGYQVEGTRGRQLQDGLRTIKIQDEPININCEVKSFDFSAHADQAGLLRFLSAIDGVQKVILIHGEESKSLNFAQRLKELKKSIDVEVPQLGKVITID